jgi:hypothetical protein
VCWCGENNENEEDLHLLLLRQGCVFLSGGRGENKKMKIQK